MKKFDPIVMLLIATCLACGVLLGLDYRRRSVVLSNSTSSTGRTVQKPSSLQTVMPLPGYAELEATTPVISTDKTKAIAEAEASLAIESEPGLIREVSVRVSGLKNQASTLCIAVFDSATGFPKSEHSRATTTVPVDAENEEFSVALPVNQSVAIAVFQDLNGDGKLTKNGFGLPIEPYGFSNNARGLLGPPSFSQAMITIFDQRDPAECVEIELR